MHRFDQKRDVVDRQAPPEMVPDHFQVDGPGEIAFAYILAAWVRSTDAAA